MTSSGTAQVWDLTDSSRRPAGPAAHETHLGGGVSAILGLTGFAAAVAPGLPMTGRWCLVLALSVTALLVAVSSLRGRQTLLTLGLALIGLLAPIGAGVAVVHAAPAGGEYVVNAALSPVAPGTGATVQRSSRAFRALPVQDRRRAEEFATALVLRLRTLHGDVGPFPAALALSQGSVVEAEGVFRGTALGAIPDRARLTYSVTPDRTAFRVTVREPGHPGAETHAESTLAVAGID